MNLYKLDATQGLQLSRTYMRRNGFAFLAIAILFLSLICSQLYASRRAAQESARTHAKNLALVLESKLVTDFEAAHDAAAAMATEIRANAMQQQMTGKYRPQITQWLKSRVGNIRSASALRYFDAHGDLLYSNIDDDVSFNIADRAFFQQARDEPEQAVIFSEVILSRSTGRTSLVVAKEIRGEHGAFLGMATTLIDLNALYNDLRNIELGVGGTVVLRRLENGAQVLRLPGPVEVDNTPVPNIPIRLAILKDGPTGSIEVASPVDGVVRLYGYRAVGSYPFYVSFGIPKSTYLAEWRRNSVTTLLASALFLIVLVAIFLQLARAESQRERTEFLHRRNADRRQGIFASLSEGLVFQDKNGGVIDANPAAEQLLGLRRDQLFGMTSMDPMWQMIREDRTPFPGDEHPPMVALRTGQALRNQIMGIVNGKGNFLWISVNANPVFGENKTIPDGVISTFSDVTERKQAEIDLRIAAIAFQSQEGMMITDTNGVILRVNQAFTDITGYTAAEAVGQTSHLLDSGRHDEYFFSKMRNTILRTGGWQGEIWGRRKNGEVHPKWLTIAAVKDETGAITHFVSTHADITERKNADAALLNLNRELSESRQRLRGLAAQNEARRERERKHIAREVHDELGQVLTALRMDISLLGMRFSALDPAMNEKVLDMKTLVDRALQGVRNVAMNLRPTALDMGLVPAIEWLRQEFIRKTQIACTLDAREESIPLDEARAVVVFRIVQESLTNITRYAQASQVVITLDLHGDELRLEIRDNGCGFDLGAARKGKTFGLLGMRERALALGGHVNIISAPDKGTIIGLSIPIDLSISTDLDTAKETP